MDDRERERGNFGKLINGVQGRTEPAIKVEEKDTAVRMNRIPSINTLLGSKACSWGHYCFLQTIHFQTQKKKKKKLETI